MFRITIQFNTHTFENSSSLIPFQQYNKKKLYLITVIVIIIIDLNMICVLQKKCNAANIVANGKVPKIGNVMVTKTNG
jgi:hypothetical protein